MTEQQKIDFASFKGRMVDLTRTGEDGVTQVVQGRIIEGNAFGIIFKARSQRTQDLIESDMILDVRDASSAKLQLISQKALRPVVPTSVRRHLADYHGVPVSKLDGMSNDVAMKFHDEIDHDDLGHNHQGDGEMKRSGSRHADAERVEVLDAIAARKSA